MITVMNGIYGPVTASIQGVTLTGGNAIGDRDGGGINNVDATLTVVNSTITDNSARSYDGGGISNFGTMIITNSTLSGNSASNYGGGIYNNGTLTVQNR